MKYLINFLKNVKFNSVRKINSVQRLRVHVMAHVIFFLLFNNALSPSRADAKETAKFRQSHVKSYLLKIGA